MTSETNGNAIRVMLVDDQELVRSGFRIILSSECDIEVVGEAVNGAEAVRLAAELRADVICMDIEMPEMNGIEASRQILERSDAPPAILMLTTFGHESYLFDAIAAGVNGFLLKTARAEQLIEAVRTLAGGGALLGPEVTRAVMDRAAADSAAQEAPASAAPANATPADGASTHDREQKLQALGLTAREREVLSLVAKGQSNSEIATTLFLGEATVKTHVSKLLQKIGARDRVQLVVWAHRNDLDLGSVQT